MKRRGLRDERDKERGMREKGRERDKEKRRTDG